MLRRTARTEVDEFIAARSDVLLRTACLLAVDRDRGEDLLQAAFADVWSAWSRSELGPDLTARRAMVRAQGRWWHPRRAPAPPAGDRPHELVEALQRLSRRQRAALVLTDADRLPEADVAEALECSTATAARLLVRARARMAVDDPSTALAMVADLLLDVPPTGRPMTVARRIDEVAHRVDVRRAWRRTEAMASLLVATLAATTVVALFPPADHGGGPHPPHPDLSPTPPLLVGTQLPVAVRVQGNDFQYFRSEEATDRPVLRVAVPAGFHPQAVAWVSSSETYGPVRLTVDGRTVQSGPPGRFESGVLLSPRRPHVVAVTASRTGALTRLGLALYAWPTR